MAFNSIEDMVIDKKHLSGTVSIGSINLTWDLTELYDEYLKREARKKAESFHQAKNGRITMYSLGIY